MILLPVASFRRLRATRYMYSRGVKMFCSRTTYVLCASASSASLDEHTRVRKNFLQSCATYNCYKSRYEQKNHAQHTTNHQPPTNQPVLVMETCQYKCFSHTFITASVSSVVYRGNTRQA